MNPRYLTTLVLASAVMLLSSIAIAQNTKPATTSNEGMPLKGRITATKGLVEVKLNESAPWQAAKVDMIVEEGGEFRTGPRSAVQFVIEPDQTITLDRLGTVKLLTAVRQATGKTKTDLGMKYGRTRYDISAGGVEHESTIRSPNSTLAVRGTKVSLTDTRPFPPEAVSLIGRAEFQSFKKEAVAFGGKNKAHIDTRDGNAAETALAQTVVDPSIALAREQSEQALIADLISRGATVMLDRESGFRTVTGGTVPTDREIVNLLPGNLNFVLRWSGNANLDLLVSSSASNETLYPSKELFVTPSGGKIPFDHQGGPNGGFEIASYPANFARGFYGVGVNHVSGPSVTANLQTYLDGQLVPITNFDEQGQVVQATTIVKQIDHLTPEQALKREATLLGIVDLSQVAPSALKQAAQTPRPTAKQK